MCQTYAVTVLELRLFEMGKEHFWGDCTAGCHFICSRIHPLCCCVSFTCSVDVVLRHHFSLQLSWLLNKCSRVTLLVSLKYSIDFSLLCFIVYLQSFLIQRAYDLVHPHHWALLLLEMENMCLATIFTRWEGSARKDGSSIYSSGFNLDDFRT